MVISAMPMVLRLPAVKAQTGLGRSTIFKLIQEGLFTRSIRLTGKATAWPSSEVAAILSARIAGRSDDEIRALVIKLEAARATADGAAA